MYLATGLWSFIVLPLLGAIRDFSGNFQTSFLCLSGTLLAGLVVWGLEPMAVRFNSKLEATEEEKKSGGAS